MVFVAKMKTLIVGTTLGHFNKKHQYSIFFSSDATRYGHSAFLNAVFFINNSKSFRVK